MPAPLTDEVAHFWAQVAKSDACWLWQGHCDERRYGVARHNRASIKAHRLAYMLTYGPIPPGLYVCHHCDNRSCVRPDHLFLGTQADNMHDMVAKGRSNHPIGTRNGRARLTEDDVRAIRALSAQGMRSPTIARRYGVSVSCIRLLISGKHWPDVV